MNGIPFLIDNSLVSRGHVSNIKDMYPYIRREVQLYTRSCTAYASTQMYAYLYMYLYRYRRGVDDNTLFKRGSAQPGCILGGLRFRSTAIRFLNLYAHRFYRVGLLKNPA